MLLIIVAFAGVVVALRVELVIFDRFDGDGGGGSEEGFLGGGVGDEGGRAGESEDELTVGHGTCDVLEELERDVGGVETGEHEDVGRVASFGTGDLGFRGFRVEGDVRLDFTFDLDVEKFVGDFFPGEGGGGGDAAGVRSAGGALGRVAEHGDKRGPAEEVVGELAGFDGDGGELLDVGVRDDAAIREEQDAVAAEVLEVGTDEDGGGEDFRHVRQRFDGVEEGAVKGGGLGFVARDEGVGLAVLDHERAEVVGAGDDFRRVSRLDFAVAGHVCDALAEQVEIRGVGWVEHLDELHRDAVLRGEGVDAAAVAEQDRDDGFHFDVAGGGAEDADVLALGENDAFRVAFQLLDEMPGDGIARGDDSGGWVHKISRRLRRAARLVWNGRRVQSDSTVPADYHSHTPLCHHAEGGPEAYVAAALAAGLTEYGVSDHAPVVPEPFDDWRMALGDLPRYFEWIARAREAAGGRIPVRAGLECDWLPGCEGWIGELAGRFEWDYLIGSVHYLGNWDFDNPHKLERWAERDVAEVWGAYWREFVAMAESGLFDILGHADLVKKFAHVPEGDLDRYYEPAVDAVAAAGCVIEINTAGWHKPCAEAYPAPRFLELAAAAGVPLVLSSDAHEPGHMGRDFGRARELALAAGFRETVLFEKRRRRVEGL